MNVSKVKSIGLLAVLLILPALLFSQVNYGFRVGTALSTFAKNPFLPQLEQESAAHTTLSVSPDAAIFMNFPISGKLRIQPEIHYLSKGGTVREDFFFSVPSEPLPVEMKAKTRYQTNFIEIPVLMKYQVSDQNFLFSLLAGGSYGKALNQELKGSDVYYFNDVELYGYSGSSGKLEWDTETESDRMKDQRNDYSVVVGFEIAKKMGNQQLLFDMRYSHDFSGWKTFEGQVHRKEIFNRNLLITLGIEL